MDSRPHILVLLPDFRVGGIEQVALALARALRRRFRFTHVAFDHRGRLEGEFRAAGAETCVIRRRPGVDCAYPLRIARLMRRCGADLVHCHNETALFYGRIGAAFASVPRVVYTEHDRAFPGPANRAVLNRVLARTCSAVVTVSGRLRRELSEHEGVDAGRISVVRNGVDERPFLVADPREEVRWELGIAPDARLVLAAGRLSPEKGMDLLLASAPAVVRAVPAAVIAIAGDGPERPRLEAMTIPGKAVLLGERKDVARLMLAADVVAVPSRSEGLPLAAIEAAAAARPVVAADVGAMDEIVRQGETGILVPPEDRGALTGGLLALLTNPALRRKMGRAAAARFLDEFTVERMARDYERVYADALSTGRTA